VAVAAAAAAVAAAVALAVALAAAEAGAKQAAEEAAAEEAAAEEVTVEAAADELAAPGALGASGLEYPSADRCNECSNGGSGAATNVADPTAAPLAAAAAAAEAALSEALVAVAATVEAAALEGIAVGGGRRRGGWRGRHRHPKRRDCRHALLQRRTVEVARGARVQRCQARASVERRAEHRRAEGLAVSHLWEEGGAPW